MTNSPKKWPSNIFPMTSLSRGSCSLALLLSSWLACPVAAQVKLVWQFKEGEKFVAECVTSFKATVVLKGAQSDQEAVNRTVLGFTVLKKKQDGYLLEEKIQSVKVTTNGGSTGFPQIPLASKWQGACFQISLTPQGEITGFKGYDAALKQVAGNNENVIGRMRSLFPKEALRQAAEAVFAILPGREVKKGDSWKHSVRVSLAPWGTLEGGGRFVYEGKKKEGEQITLTATAKYVLPDEKTAPLPFKVVGGNLQPEPIQGTILFNAATGRLVRADMKVQFKGSLIFATGESKTTIRLEQEQTWVIRFPEKK
jgi:hypothetical protein